MIFLFSFFLTISLKSFSLPEEFYMSKVKKPNSKKVVMVVDHRKLTQLKEVTGFAFQNIVTLAEKKDIAGMNI